MVVHDSRRLTGPNRWWDRPGAVIELALEDQDCSAVVDAWREQARRILDAVGWEAESLLTRCVQGGAVLLMSAPIDVLYAATEVNDWAWAATEAVLAGEGVPDVAAAAARLREVIAAERNPRLLALQAAAKAHGVAFVWDTQIASVGSGAGSLSWPVDALSDPADVDWPAVRDVPVALVTGTNGKTTTVRLVAAMATAAGLVPGLSSTDGVWIGREPLLAGDYAGPEGARAVLRDRRVQLAVLETARGGILRRGLTLTQADAAAVTNVAEDHLGDFGLRTLDDVAETKLTVARVVRADGRVVLNADDPVLMRHAAGVSRPMSWFSLGPEQGRLHAHAARGGDALAVEDGLIVLIRAGHRTSLLRVEEIPITWQGAARHNVANALAAIALASALHLPLEAIVGGLTSVRGSPNDNPGRANVIEVGGIHVLLDYAHNPHGLEAVLELAATLPAQRRLITLGQAGDRDDEAIRELARVAWRLRPDHVVVKELPQHLRGRRPGEVPGLIEAELLRLGVPAEHVSRAEDDLAAVRQALAWAQRGDLLVLLVHADRPAVLALLTELPVRGRL